MGFFCIAEEYLGEGIAVVWEWILGQFGNEF